MDKRQRNTISRKEFLNRSTSSIIGAGIAGLSAPAFLRKAHAAKNIEYRTLGKSGIKVTTVGLGGSRVKEPSLIKRIVDAGINFIDTGRMYAGGKNEEMIGKVIKDVRKEIIIQSKIDQKIQNDAAAMEKSINDSLKALRTDYIDVMVIRGATTEETIKNPLVMEMFEKAKKAGKIRLCGFSCHSVNSHEILRMGVELGYYDVAMVAYNHSGSYTHTVSGNYKEWDQDTLEKEFEDAVANGMSIISMKTCSGGPLKKEGDVKGSFAAGLKWILRNKNVSTMAVGMGSFREADEDIGAMG